MTELEKAEEVFGKLAQKIKCRACGEFAEWVSYRGGTPYDCSECTRSGIHPIGYYNRKSPSADSARTTKKRPK